MKEREQRGESFSVTNKITSLTRQNCFLWKDKNATISDNNSKSNQIYAIWTLKLDVEYEYDFGITLSDHDTCSWLCDRNHNLKPYK